MAIQSDSRKGILYALIAVACWGFLAILLKVAVTEVQPVTVVWFRFLIAFIILFLYFLIFRPKDLKILAHPPAMAILPAIFLGLNYLGFMIGISYTSPNNAQIFIQLGPVILAISGFIIYKEKITLLKAFGFIVAFIGLYYFYSQQLLAYNEKADLYNKGVLWVIFGAVSWAAYAITQKKLVTKYPVEQLNLIIFGFPALVYLLFADFNALENLSAGYWLLLFFLGVNTLIAYTAIALALKYLEANKVSIIITNNPILTFITMGILAYFEVTWIEHESMNIFSLIGAFLVISGSVIVVLSKKK